MNEVARDLLGARVALLEARRSSELSSLVERRGGLPRSAPALREVAVPCDDEVRAFVAALRDGALEVVVFLTGVGATALFDDAERLGLWPELKELLAPRVLACRGPKPVSALKARGLTPSVAAGSPFTGKELLEALATVPVDGKGVGLVHYGERAGGIAEVLRARGATLRDLCLYEWQLPEDVKPLEAMVDMLVARDVDAIAFTSQVQARHLFQIAHAKGKEAPLHDALGSGAILVVSIGPTCTAALSALGVRVDVEPASPKMVPMVDALATFLARRRAEGSATAAT